MSLLRHFGAAVSARLFVLFAAASFIFFASALLPGDFVSSFLGQDYTEATAAAMRHELGLDQPLLQRYLAWIVATVTGDFGQSFTTQTSVWSLVMPRLQNTAALTLITVLVWFPLSIAFGVAFFALGSATRRLSRTITRFVMAVPEFMLAYCLIYLCAVLLHLAPATSRLSQTLPITSQLQLFVLPSAALGIAMLAYVANQIDALLSQEETKDYFEYAAMRGRRRASIIVFLALPEIAPAVASMFFIYLAHLITGVLVIEVIFGFAGLGDLMISAVLSKDVPLMQFCALLVTGAYIAAYSIADGWSLRSSRRLSI